MNRAVPVGDNILYGTAQGILLLIVLVRGTDDVLRKVKLPIMLVPRPKRNIFSISAADQKGIKTVIAKSWSSLDLGPFSVQLRLGSMTWITSIIALRKKVEEQILPLLQFQGNRLVMSID